MIKLTLVETELSERIKWLINLRWLFILGALFIISVAYFILKVIVNPFPLYGAIGGVILLNLACTWCSHTLFSKDIVNTVSETALISIIKNQTILANAQILFDFLVLWILIFFSGGTSNFFLLYFIFHVIIASIILSSTAAYIQTTIAVLLIAVMIVCDYYRIIPQNYIINLVPDEQYEKNIYFVGMFFVLISTLYLSVFFATSIENKLRMKQDELVMVKESLERRVKDLRRLNDSLTEADKARFEYVMKVTHELRSPLSTIKNYLTVITKGYVPNVSEDVHKIIARSEKRADDLLLLINDLLSLAHLKSGKKYEEIQMIIFREIVDKIYNLFYQDAQRKNISFTVETDPSVPAINGYKSNIERLLINLISNAIKYTLPEGAVSLKVSPKNGGVKIQVSDTGIGIPKELQDKIFTDFYRTERARKLEEYGTGLGLSIVEHIVKQHSGTIALHSKENKGTTFEVILNNAE
jgi:signal transduction histidine kinase